LLVFIIIKGFDETCCNKDFDSRIHRVRVHPHKKRVKELSSLYTEQEFKAHKGVILTMKFSLDGKYLASVGEDGIVRVWQVVENERSNELNILDNDPSNIYFKTIFKFAYHFSFIQMELTVVCILSFVAVSTVILH
jgi:WD40 repeat protein